MKSHIKNIIDESNRFLIFPLVVIFATILLAGCAPLFSPAPNDDPDSNETITDGSIENVGYEWVVEPTFDYLDVINFSGRLCARLEETGSWGSFYGFIDPQKGELLNDGLPPMGAGGDVIAYDKDRGIWSTVGEFGYLTSYSSLAEILEIWESIFGFLSSGGYFMVCEVRLPSSFIVGDTADPLDPTQGHNYERIYKYALADENGLITGFLFDSFDTYLWTSRTPPLAVKQGDKWGFIDKTGKTVIPFEFDAVTSVDDDTSFVNKDGKWGIIRKVNI
ncbi:MAG: WG repeat-containing protein [Peptococcaceae bacterium]|nr:WG repeat-containing protein [Peptococcaceae bacterium]